MSHFGSIGFEVPDREALADLVMYVATSAPGRATPDGGTLMRWEDPSGAVVIVVADRDGRIDCSKPSFAAASSLPVVPRSISPDPEGCPHCDVLIVEVVNDEPLYPLAVELEDMAFAREAIRFGDPAELTVTAFGESVKSWPDADAYHAEDPVMAPESLIPSGLFYPGLHERPPVAEALITGRVTEADTRTNVRTGTPFVWARLGTYGATMEAVFAPRDLPTGSLRMGNIVQGTFWLVGRMEQPGAA